MKRLTRPRILTLLLFFLLLRASVAEAAGPAVPPVGWTEGYVLANGIRIHYWRTGGDKPALLLLHGFSDDGLCWTDLARKLEGDYDIIMTDARGHGLSDPPSASDGSDAQVEDIAGVIEQLSLKKPIIMGHSMGSASAAWFAAKYPDIPRAVILEDPRLIPRPRADSNSAGRAAAPGESLPTTREEAERQQRAMDQILARNNTPYEQLLAECQRNSPGWSRSECEYWARSKQLYHPRLALRNSGERPAMDDLFVKITAPTLILKADAQGDIRTQNEQVTATLPLGRIVHVAGAGHCVHRDQMSSSLEELRKFLSELR